MYEELVKRLRETSIDFGELDHISVMLLEAADAIEELGKPKWIPVTERLPERFQSVLSVDKNGVIAFNWISGDGKNWSTGYHVTHWMPLPEPPMEEANGT